MTLGDRIAQKRKEQSMSQEALGAELGVSRQSIYKWENNVSVPEIEKLIAMSRLFHVTVGWLLGVEETENPVQPADHCGPILGGTASAGQAEEMAEVLPCVGGAGPHLGAGEAV